MAESRIAARSGLLTRLFVFFGGLLALALIAALVAPYFINWTEYRTQFEQEASRILGQPVTVAGDTDVRLLPFPSVTFGDVRVGDEADPLVVADRFSMDVELAPFMRGEVLIFDMRIENPTINLELEDDGLPNWPLRANTRISPDQVTLENARIINGTVLVRDAKADRTWRMEDFHASVSANSLFGPYRVDGNGRLNDTPVSVRVSTGGLSAEGFGLRTVVEMPSEDIELVADGRMADPDMNGGELYGGTFTLSPLTDDAARPYAVEGNFSATTRDIEVPEFRAEFGEGEDPYIVRGSAGIGGLEEPRYEVTVEGTQITLPSDQEDPEAAPANEGDPVISLADRLAAVQATLAQLPIPPIPGSINLDLPAILAGDTTIRDIRLNASPDESAGNQAHRRWDVSHFEAKLPGRTSIEAQGVLQLPEQGGNQENAGFKGKLILASRQPSGLATWLTGSVDDAIRRLPNAGFSADVDFTPERQEVRDLEVILGEARMNGSLTRVSDPSRRNTLDVALNGRRINVEALEALSSVFVGEGGVSRFAAHDLDLSLELQDSDIRGVNVGSLSTALRSRDTTTEIDRLSVTGLFGASISATGTLDMKDGGRRAAVDATVVAPDGSELIGGLASHFPDLPLVAQLNEIAGREMSDFSDTRLDVIGTVALSADDDDEGSLSVSGKTGGTNLSVTATAKGSLADRDNAQLLLDATVQNEQAEVLISQVGFDYFVIDTPGRLEARLKAEGTLGEGLDTRLDITGADMKTEARGRIVDEDGAAGFEGQGSVRARDIEPWIAGFGYRLPGMGLGTATDLKADLVLRGGTRVVQDLSGTLDGGAVGGTVTIETGDGGPEVRGEVSLEYLNASELYAIVTGDVEALVIEAAPEDAQERLFDDAIFADHDIEVELSVGEVGLPAGDAPLRDLSTTFVYRDGAMTARNFAAQYGGGEVSGIAELQNNGGTLLLNAQVSAKDVTVASLAPQVAPLLEGKADASLQLTSTGRSTAGLLGSLTGSGVIETAATIMTGVRSDGFDQLIGEADAIGYEIKPEQIRAIAQDAFLTGETELPPMTIPLTIANGEFRMSNANVQAGRLSVSGDADLDVMTGVITGDGRLTLDPGDEAVAGPQPEITVNFTLGPDGEAQQADFDFQPVVGYVTQRALEKEQARVEAMQAVLLEKQRLRREVRLYEYRQQARLQALEEQRLRDMASERAERLRQAQERQAQEEAERLRLEAEEEAERAAQDAVTQPDATDPAPPADEAPAPDEGFDIEQLLRNLPQSLADEPANDSLFR